MKTNNIQANSIIGEVTPPNALVSQDTQVSEALNQFIGILMYFVSGLAVLSIMYAGFLFMTAAGDEEKTETAKKYLRWSIFGLAVVLLSWTITNIVITQFR